MKPHEAGEAPGDADPPRPMGLQLMRITVMGSAGCGKTSLVSSFVNGFCPNVHTSTIGPDLYYKTLPVPPSADARAHVDGGREDDDGYARNALPVLVEIEDTYPSRLFPEGLPDPDEYDKYGVTSDAHNFLQDVGIGPAAPPTPRIGTKSSNAVLEDDVRLLNGWDAPRATSYQPLANNRMGYMIVYDAHSKESLAEAIQIHKQLCRSLLLHNDISLKPIVYLVANKSDKDPLGFEYLKMREVANNYVDKEADDPMGLQLRHISAFDIRKVKRLFRDMLSEIRSKERLWRRPELEHKKEKHESLLEKLENLAEAIATPLHTPKDTGRSEAQPEEDPLTAMRKQAENCSLQ